MRALNNAIVPLCAAATFVCPVFLAQQEMLLAGIFAAIGAVLLARARSIEYAILYGAMFCIGIVGETLGVWAHLWLYTAPHQYAAFPLWILFVWANGTLFLFAAQAYVQRLLRRSV